MGKRTAAPDGKINNVTLQGHWGVEEFMAFLQFTTWVSIKKREREREDFSLKLTANTGQENSNVMCFYIQRNALGVASKTGVTSHPESLSPSTGPISTFMKSSTYYLCLL